MDKQLQFAIIGCGKIAPRHAENIVNHGKLAAVCDIIPEKADLLAASFNSKPYYSLNELLHKEKELDVAVICTPNGLHAEHSIKALHAGCHVLCEKPLCISTFDARRMITAANKCDKYLFVVKSTRYNPAILALKEMIDNRKLGKLYSFQLNCFWNRPADYYANSWKGKLLSDGGTLYTQFSHYIDAMIWLFGDVEKITGFRKNLAHESLIEFEDCGVVSMQMKNGMLGGLNWSVNTFKKNMEISLTLIGEMGSIRIGGEYMNKVEYQLTKEIKLDIQDMGEPNDYGFYKGSMSNHDKVYENLAKALMNNGHPFANGIDGYNTVEVIERIYNSVSLS